MQRARHCATQTCIGCPALATSCIAMSSQVGFDVSSICTIWSPSWTPAFAAAPVGYDIANYRRMRDWNLRKAHHEQAGQNATASTILMAGPANAMISRCQRGFARKLRGSLSSFVAWLLAGHFDVAAEQDRRETEIGFAFFEPEQPRAKTETERLHLDVEEPGRPIVAQFVDQDHDPDQDQVPPDIL